MKHRVQLLVAMLMWCLLVGCALGGIDVQRVKPELDRNAKIVFGLDWEIWSMDADGSNLIQLTNTESMKAAAISLSPDGKKIAFTAITSECGISGPFGPPLCIWVMDVDGSEPPWRLTGPHTHSPFWSPDGKKIAFSREVDPEPETPPFPNMYVTKADGSGTPDRIARCCYESATWSPDGKWIAFIRNDDIYVMNPFLALSAYPQIHKLTDTRSWEGSPSWSPDGTEIAFTRSRPSEQADIYKIDVNTLTETRLTNSSEVIDINPAWAPDGKEIAFMTNTPIVKVYKMDSDGSNPSLIRKFQRPLTRNSQLGDVQWGA
jgi:Tol biopolymer transport system component